MTARPDPGDGAAARPRTRPGASSAGAAVQAFLARIARRVGWLAGVEGAAVGLIIAAIVAAVIWRARGSIVPALLLGGTLAVLGSVVALAITAGRRRRVALLVERRAPQCRNLVVTASELLDTPARARPEIEALVLREATRTVGTLDPASLFPARRALISLGAGIAIWVLALTVVAVRPVASSTPVSVGVESLGIGGVEVTITPPAYAGRPVQTLRDPTRIAALAGSRVALTIDATAAAVNVETIDGRQTLPARGSQSFAAAITATTDGFLSIQPVASDGRAGVRRLIGLSVVPDRAPRVRVTAPGRDLFLTDARRTLAITIEADDDLALASLKLRYTKVSGSGERFTFTDGELPIAITRTDARTWAGRASLALAALDLQQGDVVVYRGVATDRRPGAVPTESDAFIVEITSPGQIASEGFAVDDDLDRNAVSQQMVILKTERLLEQRASMSAEAFTEEARNIAAEQRTVRAEFVFMMGGELAQEVTGGEAGITELNEEEEAEAGDDILAGRLANRGRLELVRAIRAMSDAASELVATRVDSALKNERLALDHLQRAFSRTRYILRALTQRERLDLTRRLTGTLVDAGRDVRPIAEPTANPRIDALRAALADIAEVAGGEPSDVEISARVSGIAERVLRVDPSSEALQRVSAQLTDVAGALASGRAEASRAALDSAALGLAAVVRSELIKAPRGGTRSDVGRLEGALIDALRRRPGAP
jgi:hypothetical protein